MLPLHQQLGLDIARGSGMTILEIIDKIACELHDYSDNGPVHIRFKKRLKAAASGGAHAEALNALVNNGIIVYKFHKFESIGHPRDPSARRSVYSVSIKNRYVFELLCTELSQLFDPPAHIRTKTPNLLYYNPVSAEGTFNGKRLKFNNKSKQKTLFELLFAYANEPVPRKKIAALLRLGNSQTQADRLNTAISNLCTKCGVKRDVITVNNSVILNAVAIPVTT